MHIFPNPVTITELSQLPSVFNYLEKNQASLVTFLLHCNTLTYELVLSM